MLDIELASFVSVLVLATIGVLHIDEVYIMLTNILCFTAGAIFGVMLMCCCVVSGRS